MENTQTMRTNRLPGRRLIHKFQCTVEAIRKFRQDRRARRMAADRQEQGLDGAMLESREQLARRRVQEQEGVVTLTQDGIVVGTAGPLPTTVVLQMAAWLATNPMGRTF
jgi:hypothetical protein